MFLKIADMSIAINELEKCQDKYVTTVDYIETFQNMYNAIEEGKNLSVYR
jgi:hypothetical protein